LPQSTQGVGIAATAGSPPRQRARFSSTLPRKRCARSVARSRSPLAATPAQALMISTSPAAAVLANAMEATANTRMLVLLGMALTSRTARACAQRRRHRRL
jgi:hypothetical protein